MQYTFRFILYRYSADRFWTSMKKNSSVTLSDSPVIPNCHHPNTPSSLKHLCICLSSSFPLACPTYFILICLKTYSSSKYEIMNGLFGKIFLTSEDRTGWSLVRALIALWLSLKKQVSCYTKIAHSYMYLLTVLSLKDKTIYTAHSMKQKCLSNELNEYCYLKRWWIPTTRNI